MSLKDEPTMVIVDACLSTIVTMVRQTVKCLVQLVGATIKELWSFFFSVPGN